MAKTVLLSGAILNCKAAHGLAFKQHIAYLAKLCQAPCCSTYHVPCKKWEQPDALCILCLQGTSELYVSSSDLFVTGFKPGSANSSAKTLKHSFDTQDAEASAEQEIDYFDHLHFGLTMQESAFPPGKILVVPRKLRTKLLCWT